MRAHLSKQTPFAEGRASVKDNMSAANPYESGSVQFRNFEIGREFGIRNPRGSSKLPIRVAKI